MLMHKQAFRYQLYPTPNQRKRLEQTLEECRWLYNETLAYRRDVWQSEQRSVTLYDCIRLLPEWKRKRPSLQMVYSQVLQNVQTRVDLAFKAFFRRVKAGEKPGYPRFRGQGRYDSFTYPQFGFALDGNRLKLSKIGAIKIRLHRPIEGKIKTLTIRQTPTGEWFACFSVEREMEPLPPSEKAVGVDVGLESFATFSDGTKVPNPRFFRRDERALARAQRRLSKAEKGTPLWRKRRLVVAHIHERIANRRRDFAHKLSRSLVNTYGLIAFEDLNTSRMLKNHCLAKSISDAAWSMLINSTAYKAAWAGRRVVLVDPRNTSQVCSVCGTLVKKELSVRLHSCPCCGIQIDRDINAARNILRLGLQSVGQSP